jgi:hypothetical protein
MDRAELDKISELLDLRLSSDGKQVRPELDDDVLEKITHS